MVRGWSRDEEESHLVRREPQGREEEAPRRCDLPRTRLFSLRCPAYVLVGGFIPEVRITTWKMGVRLWAAAAVMLCLLHTSRTTAHQETSKRLNDDGVVVKELIVGTTAENYSSVPWGPLAMCSPGSFAFAFQLKTEPIMLLGDFTGLNGVVLYCMERKTGRLDRRVTSTVGRWGLWGVVFMCTSGFLKGVQMRVEEPWEAKKDKSAVNNLAMECQDGEKMVGDGTDRGQWGEWKQCPEGTAICGLATQVVPPQPLFNDDVSLVSGAFYCCLI